MKTAFIIVLYKTPHSEVQRLKREVVALSLKGYQLYFIDNTTNNRGYAGGVNEGIKQAIKDNADYFVILNPDVSLPKTFGKNIFDGQKHFDIWSGAFAQNNKTYYGGELDKRRLSGGLITKKPETRFTECDFISGSCMVILKSTIDKIGYFDESLFLYYEDVEYSLRAKKSGLKVGIDTNLKYEHFENSQTNKDKDWYLAINRFKIMSRYGTTKQKLFEIIYAPKTIVSLIKGALQRKSFFTNFVSLNLSSVLNKLLSFLLFIVLIRLLPPHEYGKYTLVWAHAALLMPLLDLGTTTYSIINLPTQKESAFIHLFNLRWLLGIIVFMSTIILSFVFRYEWTIIGYVVLTSAVVFSNSLSGSVLIASSVLEKVYIPSIVSVTFQAILVAVLVLVLFVGNSLSWLFVATCLLYSAYAFTNYLVLKKLFDKRIKLTFFPQNWHDSLLEWKKILSGSYVYIFIGFFAGLYFYFDVFLLKWLKGVGAVGTYSAGYKFFDALMFIAASYNVTATPVLAKLYHDQSPELLKKIKSDLKLLLSIGLLAVMGMWTVGQYVVAHILKGEYVDSIAVLNIVIVALPCLLLTSVFLNLLYIVGKQKWIIGLFAFQTVLNMTLNVIFIPHYSYFASAYITVLCEILNTTITGIMLYVVLKKYEYKR